MIALCEGVRLDDGADFVACCVVKLEFLDVTVGFDARLPEMTELRLGDELFADGLERHLDRFVTIVLNGFDLGDGAGTCQNDRHGDHGAIFEEELSHADFLSKNCLFHFSTSEITA